MVYNLRAFVIRTPHYPVTFVPLSGETVCHYIIDASNVRFCTSSTPQNRRVLVSHTAHYPVTLAPRSRGDSLSLLVDPSLSATVGQS